MLETVLIVLEKGVVEDHDAPDAAFCGLQECTGCGFGCIYGGGHVLVADNNAQVTDHALCGVDLRYCETVAHPGHVGGEQ